MWNADGQLLDLLLALVEMYTQLLGLPLQRRMTRLMYRGKKVCMLPRPTTLG